jgi:hypothetical protein
MNQPTDWRFVPLEQNDYRGLEQAAYLKGLFRPFKGKGDLEIWASRCLGLREGLIDLAQRRILPQSSVQPFNLLSAQLSLQATAAGTMFLRWRNPERTAMGVGEWDKLIRGAVLPEAVVAALYAMEQQRILYNMQMSLTHSLARQAINCAAKMAHADATWERWMLRAAGRG